MRRVMHRSSRLAWAGVAALVVALSAGTGVGASAQTSTAGTDVRAAAPTALAVAPLFGFQPITPTRLYDSRSPSNKLATGAVRTVTAGGRAGIPTSGVGSVALNVTATQPTASGWLKVWPAGAAARRPPR